MTYCAVKGCKNYGSKVKKCHGISYHRFPEDPVKKEIWGRIMRKQRKDPYFKPNQNSRVCSAHFHEMDFVISKTGLRRLKGSAVPQLGLALENSVKKEVQSSVNETQSLQIEEIDVDISDLDPIFDSPRTVKLNKRVTKLEQRLSITVKKVKRLQKENAKLKKKNQSLINIIKDLKEKKYMPEQTVSVLEENAEIENLYNT